MLDETWTTDETLEITPYGDVELHDVVWDHDRELIDLGYDAGYDYGDCRSVEFIKARLGGLTITRDMLIQMLSSAQVEALEDAELERANA